MTRPARSAGPYAPARPRPPSDRPAPSPRPARAGRAAASRARPRDPRLPGRPGRGRSHRNSARSPTSRRAAGATPGGTGRAPAVRHAGRASGWRSAGQPWRVGTWLLRDAVGSSRASGQGRGRRSLHEGTPRRATAAGEKAPERSQAPAPPPWRSRCGFAEWISAVGPAPLTLPVLPGLHSEIHAASPHRRPTQPTNHPQRPQPPISGKPLQQPDCGRCSPARPVRAPAGGGADRRCAAAGRGPHRRRGRRRRS